jgi:O-antigen/teichoic acid export membrane protein
VVAAPYVLHFLGPGYTSATGVLRLLALSAIPALITNTAISVTRSQRNMRMVTGIQVVICAVVWGLSATLMGPLGITGVGVAWLVAQTVTALALAAWPRLWLPARQPPLPEQAAWPRVPRPSIEGPSGEATHEDTVHESTTAPDISQRRGGNPRSST